MKVNVVKTVKVIEPLDLGEYTEGLRGQTLYVWVNPPQELRLFRAKLVREFNQAMKRTISAVTLPPMGAERSLLARAVALLKKPRNELESLELQLREWTATILSQSIEPCSAEDLKELQEADRVLFEWILKRIVEMMEDWRAEKKRPSVNPSLN